MPAISWPEISDILPSLYQDIKLYKDMMFELILLMDKAIIWKPTQIGKTEEVLKIMDSNIPSKKSLNVVITMNRQNQATQFSDRVRKKFVADEIIQLHGNADADSGKYADVTIIGRIKDGTLPVIIAICNPKRLDVVKRTVERWLRDDPDNNVMFFFDEADVIWKQAQKTVGFLTENYPSRIKSIRVSATNEVFVRNEQEIFLHPNSVDHSRYTRLSDMEWRDDKSIDANSTVVAYVERVIKTIKLDPKEYLLTPSGYKTKQHHEMLEMLVKHNIAVLLINGDGFHFWVPDMRTYETHAKSEFGGQVEADIIYDFRHRCLEYPFALTGNGCIGRSVTCQKPGLYFTRAIIAKKVMESKDNLYQICGRMNSTLEIPFRPVIHACEHVKNIALSSERYGFAATDGRSTMSRDELDEMRRNIQSEVPEILPMDDSLSRIAFQNNPKFLSKINNLPRIRELVNEGYVHERRWIDEGRAVCAHYDDALSAQRAGKTLRAYFAPKDDNQKKRMLIMVDRPNKRFLITRHTCHDCK